MESEVDIVKEVHTMCNLSLGIVEETEEKLIISMHENGIDDATIAKVVKITVEQVKSVLAKYLTVV